MTYTRGTNRDFPVWMYDFLLEGREPEPAPEINPFQALMFVGADPSEDPCRHGRGPTWFSMWDMVKDGPVVQAWRKENPGRIPHAEELLSDNFC